MKNFKLILAAAVMSSAFGANAEVLYWMTESYKEGDADYAQLYYTADPDDTTAGTEVGGELYLQTGESYIYGYSDLAATEYGSSPTETFFYVSIYDESGATVFTGNAASYQYLQSQGFIRDIDSSSAGSHWDAAAVPEPTGGVLLLLGAALLGLRRKRVEGCSASL